MVAFVLVVVLVVGVVWSRRRVTRGVFRLHIISEHGFEDATVEGIFVGFASGHYRLANARHLQSDDDPVALDGEAWIPRVRVLYAQRLG